MAKSGKARPKAGRSKRALPKSEPRAEPQPTDTDTIRRFTPERKLKSLLASNRAHQKQISGITGTLREEIANAVKNDHLHKGAFAIIKRWDKMEPEALALEWDHLLDYWEKSGLKARADSVQRLSLEDGDTGDVGEAGDADEGDAGGPPATILPAAEGEADAENVTRPRFGAH